MAGGEQNKLTGRWGEAVAADYLRGRGYRILGMNYSCRAGEVDLIAENRRYVIFVEVKLRKSAAFAEAREFVTEAKQRRVQTAAALWLQKNPGKKQPRFDVIEIYAPEGTQTKNPRITHIENAFEALE